MADSKKNKRYRNPANDLIDAAVGGTKKAARAAGSTAKKSVKAAQTAGSRTVKRQEQQEQQGLGLRGRRKRQEEKTKATKPAPKPAAKPVKQGDYVSPFAGARDAYFNQAGRYQVPKGAKPAPKPSPKPAPKPAPQAAPKPSASTSTPKPAGKVPSSSETYRDGGKGLYQGSKEYRDKVGGSGNPLLNRFRKDMGRDTSTGSKTSGTGPVASGADYSKSIKVAKAQSDANKARIKQGPGSGTTSKPKATKEPQVGYEPQTKVNSPDYSKSKTTNNADSTYNANSDAAKKLQEAQKERAAKLRRDAEERARKARERLAASASKKPGSTYG